MLKVCHMSSVHSRTDTRIFYKECVSLANAGYKVYFVVRGDDSEEVNGVKIIGAGSPNSGRISRMTTFVKKVYHIAIELDADIYHVHDPELLLYVLKLKKRGKKVIFDSHENYSMQIASKPYLPKLCSMLLSRLYRVFENYIVKSLDAVIFPSTIKGVNIFEDRTKRAILIGNDPIMEKYLNSNITVTKDKEFGICYIGGLTEARGITNSMKAAYLAKTNLVLAGIFTNANYHEELKNMNEYRCIDYRGQLSKEEVVKILSEVSVGICLLRNVGQYHQVDNLATKICEYMAAGLPIIVTNSAFNKQVVDKYHCGICVDEEDVKAIAEAILYLKNNPLEAKTMGENGRRAVEEEFNWSIQESKLLKLYAEIIEK